jgi:acyl-coenzyme A thioesterase 13
MLRLMTAVPDGFLPLFRTSPFLDAVGPLFHHGSGAAMAIGFHVATKHTNARGALHGGVLATVGDVALGYALATSTDPPGSFVTASLSIDFVGGASIGDWVQSSVDIQKIGGRLAFASVYFHVGDQRIARASGVFAVMDRTR